MDEVVVYSSHMPILVNGSPTKKSNLEIVLRQGDPLLPFLFVLVVEGLSGLVRRSVELGDFFGFNINGKCLVDILRFADDKLLIGEGSWNHVWALKTVLRGFEVVSRLRVNYHKSKLVGINLSPHFLNDAANFLSCKIEDKVFSFLGITIGSNPKRISSWQPLIHKLKTRLSSWQGRMLNFGGRITLLKYGGTTDKRRIHWVSWEQVSKPFDKGRLGMNDIEVFNNALLSKLEWKILEGKDCLWMEILRARYKNLQYRMLAEEGMSHKGSKSSW
ncbi:uncharacterized protein LOC131657988 [Vicia villosa]|uniref:uncharacterized protein LOC131657988 n=1 Tax=Vicia villosa TaxID=3911 RepID=UPI00273B2525|nr:uncharacterized protein LOC131657988 [Vicia villosa]